MLQPSIYMLQLKILHAATETEHSQKKKKDNLLFKTTIMQLGRLAGSAKMHLLMHLNKAC